MDSLLVQSMFHSAACASHPNRIASSKLCPKGFVSMVPKDDSQVRLASRLKFTLNAGFTEKFDGHVLPERRFRLFFRRNDSLGDISGYDHHDDDSSSLEELRYQLVRAKKDLEDLSNAMILKSVRLSITLEEEAASAKKEVKDCEEKLASCNEELMRLQILMDELQKEVENLSEAAEKALIQALEVAAEVNETMIWGEQGSALEREACEGVIDAEKALQQRAESDVLANSSSFISADTSGMLGSRENEEYKEIIVQAGRTDEELRSELVRAKNELQHVRDRNAGILKSVELLLTLEEEAASAKKDVKECEEKLASCNEELMRLQILKDELQKEVEQLREAAETAQITALEVENEVNETMIWGEQGRALEREACQDVIDAEEALEKAESDVLANSSFFISAGSRENEEYTEITSRGADKLKVEDERCIRVVRKLINCSYKEKTLTLLQEFDYFVGITSISL